MKIILIKNIKKEKYSLSIIDTEKLKRNIYPIEGDIILAIEKKINKNDTILIETLGYNINIYEDLKSKGYNIYSMDLEI